MEKSISLGILGGIGLGLLLGSEFSGTYVTILGAILLIVFLVSLVLFKKK
ncbi:MAG: hypothetical protein KAT37_05105 [Candidatus Aenigmarchaeota archaeon]|nr:hypothetical protein [Candidatus Aenigmarchaeota archaeon]